MNKKYTFTYQDFMHSRDMMRDGLSPWIPVNGSNNRPVPVNLVYPFKELNYFLSNNKKQLAGLEKIYNGFREDPTRRFWYLTGSSSKDVAEFELSLVPPVASDLRPYNEAGVYYDSNIYNARIELRDAGTPSTVYLFPILPLRDLFGNLDFVKMSATTARNISASISYYGPKFGEQVTAVRFPVLNPSDAKRRLLIKNTDGTVWELGDDLIYGIYDNSGPNSILDLSNIAAVSFIDGWEQGDQIEFWF